LGHILQDGKDRCGKTQKCDIGIVCNDRGYAELCEEKDIVKLFPKRARNTNKGSFGTATLIAGSEQYIGTAQLALGGALKSGCGYVKLCCHDKLKYAIAPIYPQAIYCDSEDLSSDCIAIGMGCGVSTALYEKIKYLLTEYKGTLIIDADGLNTLAKYGVGVLKDAKCKVILTPHIKEFSRLSGQDVSKITQNSVDLCRDFANDKGVTVLLKSSSSILSDGKKVVVIDRGSSALAKAGSGDMLSGFMCGSIARGLSPFNGAMCAGYVLGCAGELVAEQFTEYCANSADILNILPCVVKRLTH
jgi:NAD(P)H-hydrate epimerase